MKKLPLLLGIGLLLGSLGILVFLGIRIHTGNQNSREVVSQIISLLPERTQGETRPDSQMPVLALAEADYAALLEIPAFGVTLPVADKWDSRNLYSAPRRFCGSAYDSTLVIGGADSPGQFSFCDKIDSGALVFVTDMTGSRFSYTVARVDRAKHAEAQWLQSSDWDLTLFCRDMYSMEYIAVRCVLSHK